MGKVTRGMAVALIAAGVVPATASAADDPATYRCRQAAWAAGYSTAKFHLVVGTDGNDAFTAGQLVPSARDIVCGFDGDDSIAELKGGDVFLGGLGADRVTSLRDAAFVGGPGADRADDQQGLVSGGRAYQSGPFYGGAGADSVGRLWDGSFFAGDGADHVDALKYGGGPFPLARFVGGSGNDTLISGEAARAGLSGPSFEGGPGADLLSVNGGSNFAGGSGEDRIGEFNSGWFTGGPGADTVGTMEVAPFMSGTPTFWGEDDDDYVNVLRDGVFNGGAGLDAVGTLDGGTFNQD